MKTSLTHLPPDKRSYVQEVANIIIEEMTKSKKGLAYLILFGGYARGDWVYESGYDIEEKHDYSYISDLDILISGCKSLTQVIDGIIYRNIIRLSSTK